ncbi:MAG: hypothetical protein AAF497_28635 [Planctomycetota bacterium]
MSGQSNPSLVCPGCGTVATVPGGYCASCGQRLPAAQSPMQAPTQQPINPYAASGITSSSNVAIVQDPAIIQRAETVIKDAGQVILAVLIGFVCTGLAAFIIGPFYVYRLYSWNRLAEECPALLSPGAPQGSLEQRFQAAKGKLIVGVVIGCVLFVMFMGAIVLAMFG